MQITGPGGASAKVDRWGGLVCGGSLDQAYWQALKRGDAWGVVGGTADVDVGDSMLAIRNNDKTPLVIWDVIINGGNATCAWDIGKGSAITAFAGTVLTPINMGAGAGLPNFEAYQDETGVSDLSVVARTVSGVLLPSPQPQLRGLILPHKEIIQFNQEVELTSGSVSVVCFYCPELLDD